MNLFAVLFLAILSLVKADYFGGVPSFLFGQGLDPNFLSGRDSRQDRGPVVFPPAPPDNGETSGVIPGASGYGFVPTGNSESGSNRPFYW